MNIGKKSLLIELSLIFLVYLSSFSLIQTSKAIEPIHGRNWCAVTHLEGVCNPHSQTTRLIEVKRNTIDLYVILTINENFDPDYTISVHAPSEHRTGSKTLKDPIFRSDILFSSYSIVNGSVQIRVRYPILDSYFSGLCSYEDLSDPEFMTGKDIWFVSISNPSYYPKTYNINVIKVMS